MGEKCMSIESYQGWMKNTQLKSSKNEVSDSFILKMNTIKW